MTPPPRIAEWIAAAGLDAATDPSALPAPTPLPPTVPPVTDGTLVAQVLSGTTEAYTQLVERHQRQLSRYALRMLGNAQEAEDAVQEAFVRGYRSLAKCEDPERYRAWLFQILVNRCRTRAKAAKARAQRFVATEPETEPRVPHPEAASAWREEIDRALAELPSDQREAFLLKYVEELSYEEISGITGASLSALKMRVKRACERLKDLLKDAYDSR
jgi:RNA polymerase sigma-70 factor, ECF subfamily